MDEFKVCPVCGGELQHESEDVGGAWGGERASTQRQVCPKGCHETVAWTEAKEARGT